MREGLYSSYIPANARVIVEYGAKEPVRFSYPREWTYWKAVRKCAFPTVRQFWTILHMLPMVYFFMIFWIPIVILSIISFIVIDFNEVSTLPGWQSTTGMVMWGMGCFLSYFYILPAIFTVLLALNKERMSRWLPKIGYWTGKLIWNYNQKTYKPEDVFDKKAYLPTFSNVYLHYVCTGDFEKYLTKVEVMDIPFEYVTRSIFWPFKKRITPNDHEFSAVFHFSEQPKEGEMTVRFD